MTGFLNSLRENFKKKSKDLVDNIDEIEGVESAIDNIESHYKNHDNSDKLQKDLDEIRLKAGSTDIELEFDDDNWVLPLMEAMRAQLDKQVEDEALKAIILKVQNLSRIKQLVLYHSELAEAILMVLQKLEIKIPWRVKLYTNKEFETQVVDFTENRKFSQEQILLGLVYACAELSNNSYKLKRLNYELDKNQRQITSLGNDNLKLQRVIEDLTKDLKEVKSKNLKEVVEDKLYIVKYEDKVLVKNNEEGIGSAKDYSMMPVESDSSILDTASIFDDLDTVQEVINMIRKSNRLKKKKNKKIMLKNPHKWEILTIGYVK